MIGDDQIAEAGRTLAGAASSPARVVLFGSRARGDTRPGSDLDFLVIEERVDSKLSEMVRLRDGCPRWASPSTSWLSRAPRRSAAEGDRGPSSTARFRRGGCSLSPEREEAELLLRKAREDQVAVARFAADEAVADSVIGFHAQQAVETIEASGVEPADDVRAAPSLAPWAVEFRYGETIDEQLDREEAARLVDATVDWATERVAECAS